MGSNPGYLLKKFYFNFFKERHNHSSRISPTIQLKKALHLLCKLKCLTKINSKLSILALKMKVGLGIEKDVEHVKEVRKAIGENMELMIDSNHAYSLKEALELAR